MNKINPFKLVIIFISCFILQGCGKKQVTTYYDSSQENIEQRYTVNRITNQKEGIYRYFAPNGKLLIEAEYYRGKLHGDSKVYCETSSTVFEEAHYYKDKLDGKCYEYYCENGQLRSEVLYDEGDIIEVVNLFDIRGNNLFPGNHKAGNGQVLKYDSEGNLSARFNIRDGKIHGYYEMITNTGYIDSTWVSNGYDENSNYHYDTY